MPVEEQGQLLKQGDDSALRFERVLPHPPEMVWEAITRSDLLSEWFPADLQGRHEAGAAIRIVSFAGRFEDTDGLFRVYDAPRRLTYSWGREEMDWQLTEAGAGTRLVFTNVLDADAEATGVAAIAASWHACLDVLVHVLDGHAAPWTVDARFDQLISAYEADMGSAGT